MKIGILGAPGVGKHEFACELRDLLQTDERMLVITGYVDTLRNDTHLEYGEFGDFVDDLQVVFKRREWELGWTDRDTITVGTVLDSVIHNFIRTEPTAESRHEIGVNQERLKAIAATFGLLYTETWDYDYAFFLRSDDEYGLALSSLLLKYRAPVLSFNPEVPRERYAETAANAIRALEKAQPSSPQERGVRRGGETGEAVGDSTEPVPDVSESRGTPDDA